MRWRCDGRRGFGATDLRTSASLVQDPCCSTEHMAVGKVIFCHEADGFGVGEVRGKATGLGQETA